MEREKKNYKFVSTNDIETRDRFIKNGFKMISSSAGHYTFINNDKLLFADTTELKFTYTNVLCI